MEWLKGKVSEEEKQYILSFLKVKRTTKSEVSLEEKRTKYLDEVLTFSPRYSFVVCSCCIIANFDVMSNELTFKCTNGQWCSFAEFKENPNSFVYWGLRESESDPCPVVDMYNWAFKDLMSAKFCWVGWNNKASDIPILEHKLAEADIHVPHNHLVLDLMNLWDCPDWKGVAFKEVLMKHGIKPRSGARGSEVAQMWEENKPHEIIYYCASDVIALVDLFKTRSQRLSRCVR
jgi:hypothetical protein